MKSKLLLSVLVVTLMVQISWGQIPQTMSYQGILTDGSGVVVPDGSYGLTLRIYDVETNGTALWSETHPSVAVVNGIFNVILGSVNPLNIAFDAQYWLEVEVNGSVLSPRVQLTSAAYSLNAQSVADNAVTGDKIADGQVVRSINGKTDIVSLLEGANISITPGLNSLTISATNDWSLTGNAGTSPPTNFLGTTDDSPLALHVFGARVLLLEPHSTCPNIIGGHSGNWITDGVFGATIGGGGASGSSNSVTDDHGTVGGGYGNVASGISATIGGGVNNEAGGVSATISGGVNNTANGYTAIVGGGEGNSANGSKATVPGGFDNSAAGTCSFAAGSRAKALHKGCFVWGDSTAGDISSSGVDQFIARANGGVWMNSGAGGLRLEPHSTCPNIIGGYSGNWVTDGVYGATIGGGGIALLPNRVTGDCGTVGGGKNNIVSAFTATVGGGCNNTASGVDATVGGGWSNTASGNDTTIAGGYENTADAFAATIGGGFSNIANVNYATVGGGDCNIASGVQSTAPGGYANRASGVCSFAAGNRAKADADGCFAWADMTNADFTCTTDNSFNVRCYGGARFMTGKVGILYTGVKLDPGATSWSVTSDRNVKENFAPVDGQDVLKCLASIPIETWNCKAQDPSIRHMGPMAQDFYAAFGLGSDDKHISTIDPDGVALAAIQGLYELVQEKDDKIASQDKRIADLEARLAMLEASVLSRDQ